MGTGMKHTLSTAVAGLETDGARLAQGIADAAGSAADLLQDAGEKNLARAQVALSGARTAIRRRGGEMADATSGYVDAHPWQALGLAAVAGLLAGVALSRR
jgi:ElaB/YqjD/DUF883 family membrane-anchored ribosome-binding protein